MPSKRKRGKATQSLPKRVAKVVVRVDPLNLNIIKRIILPQLFPYIISAARSGLALIWKIVLVVELLGRSNGVGFKINEFFSMFDTTSILAYTLTFVAFVMAIEWFGIKPLERKLTEWRI